VFRVEHDLDKLQRSLTAMERKQFPFAQVLTVTRLASVQQQTIRNDLPKKFRIRRKAWARTGVLMRKAEKKGPLESFVWMRDWYWQTHETGGTRKPRSSRFLTVPLNEKMRRALKRTKNDARVFIARGKKGLVILERSGKGRGKLRLLGGLEKAVDHKEKLGFMDTANRTMKQTTNIFRKSLAFAVKTNK